MHIFYTASYYDGPVEGLLMWRRHVYYFVWHGEDLDAGVRIFLLARLEPYQYFMLRTCDTRELIERLPTFESYGFDENYTQEYTPDPRDLPQHGFYLF